MSKLVKEELNRMKYLFSHERGIIISEQKNSNLLTEDIGAHPKDQARADAFRKYLNTPPMSGYTCQVGKSKGMRLVDKPGKKFTGPCMRAAWSQYGEAFKTPTKIEEPIVPSLPVVTSYDQGVSVYSGGETQNTDNVVKSDSNVATNNTGEETKSGGIENLTSVDPSTMFK